MADVARAVPSDREWSKTEGEIVAELQAGSDAAFDWLVIHYHGLVYGLVYGMLGDAGDAADATQEVFLKAFRGLRSFRRGSSLKTWLYRIAVREALNQRRWWWRHRRREVSLEAEIELRGPAGEIEADGDSPFDRMAAAEAREVVQRALAAVPEVFRTAVILRDLEGLSYEEVAEVLDVSVGTVKSRILRGRRALRDVLTPLLAPRQIDSAGKESTDRVAPIPSGAASRPLPPALRVPSVVEGSVEVSPAEGGAE